METLILYCPKKELKELFANQCEPCVTYYPKCKAAGGNPEKAKKWRCPQFCNGFGYIRKVDLRTERMLETNP
jgi:hypothetical protein